MTPEQVDVQARLARLEAITDGLANLLISMGVHSQKIDDLRHIGRNELNRILTINGYPPQ